PLLLGVAIPSGAKGVNLTGETAGVSRRHCSLRRQGDEVIVEDHSTYGSYLNGSRIEGRAELSAGDRLRLGAPGIELHLIAVE
ncbi:MAG: FHA domain-containing protein, partial [Thermoanaerobaculia bacterium]